jgi:hypothetical protein
MTPSSSSPTFDSFRGDPDSITTSAGNPQPADLELPVQDISPQGRDPLVAGGHSDVWRAYWMRDGVSTLVSSKTIPARVHVQTWRVRQVALKVLRRNGRTQDEVNEVCVI